MGSYSFHYIENGKKLREQEAFFHEDLEALDAANLLCEEEIEIWTADRFVARVRRGDAPPATMDKAGG